MLFYKTREEYWRSIAIAHDLIQHESPVTMGSDELRNSFFRINDEEELNAASENWIHFPCLVMIGLSGTDLNKDGWKVQLNINSLMILTKAVLDPEQPFKAPSLTEAYELTWGVMDDIKNQNSVINR